MATFQRYLTVSELITQTMQAMGLVAPPSIVGSTNKTAAQLLALANELGLELIGDGKWQAFDRELTITTSIGVTNYPIPADLDSFASDAQWNYTTRLPAVGPLADWEWQMLKARNLAGTTFTMLFRIVEGEVVFYETPSTVQTIVMPYTGRGWVLNNAGTDYQDNILADDDQIIYDQILFKMGLKLKWREAKGFDTTAATKNFNTALSKARSADTPGRTLSMVSTADYPYLGVINIPDTNYGQP